MLGADITNVTQQEAGGARFYDVDGTQKDFVLILKNHGFNYVRLHTFVNPAAALSYADLAHTVTMGARVKAAGMGLLIDFHMSDTWADPGHQATPAAWTAYSMSQLVTAVQSYTNSAITALVSGGARPDMVAVGNEITSGMLFPSGQINGNNFAPLGQLLSAGIAGVKAVDSSIKIMMHIDTGGTNSTTTWWVTGVQTAGVSFDVLGLSCYTAYADQGPPANWQSNFSSLITQYPNLSLAMAEYDEGAPDISGNLNIWRQANDIVFKLPNKRGAGTFMFEPTFTASWDQPLLDFTSGNNVTPLADPLNPGSARIQQYDLMKTAYGL